MRRAQEYGWWVGVHGSLSGSREGVGRALANVLEGAKNARAGLGWPTKFSFQNKHIGLRVTLW